MVSYSVPQIEHLIDNINVRGETGLGKWSVVVKDTEVNEHNGSFTDWKMTLWGECIDPSIQELRPLPTEHDDDDHDVMTASPTFVSIDPGASQTELPTNPTDHQDRPVNAKPTVPADTSVSATSTSASASASASASTSESAAATSLPSTPPEEDKDSHFLPHYFPTFGVSKRTQIWIYGALAIIVLFCAGLGTYFFIQRRKRRRSEREDYEFEILDDEDATLNGGLNCKGTKRRAGELYDAFAGESDEEGLLSDDEENEEHYRDETATAGEERGRRQSREVGEK